MVQYVDIDEDYPELMQPPGEYVRRPEDERDRDAEVTWPQIHERPWELFDEENPDGV